MTQPAEPLKGFESLEPGTYSMPGGGLISYSHTPPSRRKPGAPILVLLHGWPQTRYMWRYAVPVLSEKLGHTLFVPDLPGYGYSKQSTSIAKEVGAESAHDRVSVGYSLLSAVRAAYGTSADEELDVVLIGHDRGGRVSQRLITSVEIPGSLQIRILGAVILDIVPYAAQWSSHANPRSSVAYWHWSFLPSPLSTAMIEAYGPGRFCREILSAAGGGNEAGRESFAADGAIEHYAACYEREEVYRGAVADYSAGAAEDWDAQQKDMKLGHKVQVPLRVLYCERLQQINGDVEAIWRQWVAPDVKLDMHLVPGGVGHYLPEEAPQEVNQHIVEFLEGLGL